MRAKDHLKAVLLEIDNKSRRFFFVIIFGNFVLLILDIVWATTSGLIAALVISYLSGVSPSRGINQFLQFLGHKEVNYEVLLVLLSISTFSFLLRSLFQMLLLYFQNKRQSSLVSQMSHRNLKKVFEASIDSIQNIKPHELNYVVFTGIANGVNTAITLYISIFCDLILCIGLMLFLAYVDLGIVSILTFAAIAIYLFNKKLINPKVRNNSHRATQNSLKLQNAALEIYEFQKEIILYETKDFYLRKYLKLGDEFLHLSNKNIILLALGRSSMEALGLLALPTILILATISKSTSEAIFTTGVIVTSFARLVPLFVRLNAQVGNLNSTLAGVELYYDLKKHLTFETESDTRQKSSFTSATVPSTRLHLERGRIQIRNLSCGFNDRVLFRGLDLVVDPGKLLVICGPSGSGKSTLANTISGLRKPLDGEVIVDDLPLTDWKNIEGNRISLMRQNISEFSVSLFDFVSLGRTGIREVEVLELCSRLRIDIESKIGAGKDWKELDISKLSGGERQRLRLLQSIIILPSILIWDEPSTYLDQNSETEVREILLNLGMTRIAISHDKSYIKCADTLCFVSGTGNIFQGTFDNLIHSSNEFRDFYDNYQESN